MASEIDQIIPAEIADDELHALIEQISRTQDLKHVLEIGSSAGAGSTRAFVSGLALNPNKPNLYCMELSKQRFEALRQSYADQPFVHCFNVSSVPVSAFPSAEMVTRFYQNKRTSLNRYPLERVLGWLRQDIAYIEGAGADKNGIAAIKAARGIDTFDLVLIDGSEFTGSAELDEIIGAKFILLDDTNAYKCYEARARLLGDPRYEVIADNQDLRNGYSAFRRRDIQVRPYARPAPLPVHFFTIVLNGEPFIRYHLEMLRSLPFRWRWHIVEGVADLVHDTAWSVAGGGRIDASLHDNGRSNDGTSAYLDQIAAEEPDRITLYRKPQGSFWNGKKEMVAAPLANIAEPCLLWQVDADELWTSEQVQKVRAAFLDAPERSAAFFWCHYYVGPQALISTRYNYAQNPDQEWLRVWRYSPGDHWAAHEPPTLIRARGPLMTEDVAKIAPFSHDEMEKLGAVFQHFAYVTPEQLRFKEVYYGYSDATNGWRALQGALADGGAVLLRDYFPWVTDDTMVERAADLGVAALATPDDELGGWTFERNAPKAKASSRAASAPVIAIDGVFFQHNQKSGIARVWRALLREWIASGFAAQLVLFDRAGTAPRIKGLRTRSLPAWSEKATAEDAFILQAACDAVGADLFISSYYTTPLETPSVFLAHDMIPEKIGAPLSDIHWREKKRAISHAARFLCISENTRNDLLKLNPEIDPTRVSWAHNGVDSVFRPADDDEIFAFRKRYDLSRPYLVIVGERLGASGYKNGALFFQALQRWARRDEFDVLAVGGQPRMEDLLRRTAPDVRIVRADLTDAELRAAYSGAAALVYPSREEGFGMPVLEAMACGCPPVAARASSLPEIMGDAGYLFQVDSADDLLRAIELALAEGRAPAARDRMSAHAAQFDWRTAASAHADELHSAALAAQRCEIPRCSPIWRLLREEQRFYQRAISQSGAGADEFVASHDTLTSPIARSRLRQPLFELRSVLLKALPRWTLPAAQRAWRIVMGVRA